MDNHYYVLEDHKVVAVDDVITWAKQFEFIDRKVAKETIGDVSVSTVFLGINHAFDDGPPLLFETMVFGGPLDQEQERYSTWEEAEAGHKAMVERVKKGENA